MSYLIGIDLGSTNLKVLAYHPNGRVAAQASGPNQVLHPNKEQPDWAIWDPDHIWNEICRLLKQVVSQLDDPKNVKGVAVTGMGMDGVPIAKDGSVLYPFISWHCPRTIPQQKWWLENIGAEKQFSITGNPVWHINTALRLLWMKEHEPKILEKTDKWLLIEDFLNFKLCGEYATDYSMASNTLLFDQKKREWSEELFKLSGIDKNLFADPRSSGTVIGQVHAEAAALTGLAKGTPIVLGGHDFLCGALPVGAFKPDVLLNVLGTWDFIVAALPEPVLTPEVGAMGAWIDSHVALDTWAVIGTAVAGEATEWFRREFCFEEKAKAEKEGDLDWDYLVASAKASTPGANDVFFLPHLAGSTFPVVDPDSKGAFLGLRSTTTKGDMYRAVIEGLNFQLLQIMKTMEAGLNLKIEKSVAVGGGTKNHFAMQNKADMMGKVLEVADVEEATPLGAAILAGIGTGVYKDEQEAYEAVYRKGKVYEPNEALTKFYQEKYEIFEQIYPALKGIFSKKQKQENNI